MPNVQVSYGSQAAKKRRLGASLIEVIQYHENFSVDDAAPLTTPRNADIAGQAIITDTNDVMDVDTDSLKIDGSTAANDGVIVSDSGSEKLFSRETGLALIIHFSNTFGSRPEGVFGFSTSTLSSDSMQAGIEFRNSPDEALMIFNTFGYSSIPISSFDAEFAIILRSNGAFGVDITNKKLLFAHELNSADVYAKLFLGSETPYFRIETLRVATLGGVWASDAGPRSQSLSGAQSAGTDLSLESDFILKYTIDTLPSSGEIIRFTFRVQDASNYYRLEIDDNGNTDIYRVDAGVPTLVGGDSSATEGWDATVLVTGSWISIWYNNAGTPVGPTYEDSTVSSFTSESGGELELLDGGSGISDIEIWPVNLTDEQVNFT